MFPPAMLTEPGPARVVPPIDTRDVVFAPLSASVLPVDVPRLDVPVILVIEPPAAVYVLPHR